MSRSRAARGEIWSGAVSPIVLPTPGGGLIAGTLGVVSHDAQGIDAAALRALDQLAAFIGRGLAPLS